eukprot:6212154-Pleurochrysis_carterae.AAC.1
MHQHWHTAWRWRARATLRFSARARLPPARPVFETLRAPPPSLALSSVVIHRVPQVREPIRPPLLPLWPRPGLLRSWLVAQRDHQGVEVAVRLEVRLALTRFPEALGERERLADDPPLEQRAEIAPIDRLADDRFVTVDASHDRNGHRDAVVLAAEAHLVG